MNRQTNSLKLLTLGLVLFLGACSTTEDEGGGEPTVQGNRLKGQVAYTSAGTVEFATFTTDGKSYTTVTGNKKYNFVRETADGVIFASSSSQRASDEVLVTINAEKEGKIGSTDVTYKTPDPTVQVDRLKEQVAYTSAGDVEFATFTADGKSYTTMADDKKYNFVRETADGVIFASSSSQRASDEVVVTINAENVGKIGSTDVTYKKDPTVQLERLKGGKIAYTPSNLEVAIFEWSGKSYIGEDGYKYNFVRETADGVTFKLNGASRVELVTINAENKGKIGDTEVTYRIPSPEEVTFLNRVKGMEAREHGFEAFTFSSTGKSFYTTGSRTYALKSVSSANEATYTYSNYAITAIITLGGGNTAIVVENNVQRNLTLH